MNIKRLVVTCVVVFVVIFAFEWLLHGVILRTDYVTTGYLWRPQDEMQQQFRWLMFGQFVVAASFAVSYAFVAKAQCGIRCGLMYGLVAGLMLSGPNFITYAVQPMPAKLIGAWTVGRLIEMMLCGAICALAYRPISTPKPVVEPVTA